MHTSIPAKQHAPIHTTIQTHTSATTNVHTLPIKKTRKKIKRHAQAQLTGCSVTRMAPTIASNGRSAKAISDDANAASKKARRTNNQQKTNSSKNQNMQNKVNIRHKTDSRAFQ